ncbi:MAG: DUF5700 domain-containing putative Zn-dependent protease [Bacteroidota bacterium]
MKKIALLLALVFLRSGAQTVETDISACSGMLSIFEQMRSNTSKAIIEQQLDSILLTRPYEIMFQHYNRDWRPNHLPKHTFKKMILSLKFPNTYDIGTNERADAMLPFWKNAFSNIKRFRKNIQALENTNLSKAIQLGVLDAQKWLPESMSIPDFYFFVHPNGGSSAFAIKGKQGYDFFKLPKHSHGTINIQELVDIIAHESHHLGLKIAYPKLKTAKDSLAYEFLQVFVAEGTASKFVDNLPGGCIAKVSEGRSKNYGKATQEIWSEYTLQEKQIFNAFEQDFQRIYDGTYTEEDIQQRIRTYWLSGIKGRAYFLGSELYGAVFKAFGKEELFNVMEHPKLLLKKYNEAIFKLRESLTNEIYLSNWLTLVF